MCKRRKMVILPVVTVERCVILFLKEPVLAAEGFANGLRLCTSTVLPALFPFFVLTDLLLTCPLRNRIFRPAARLLGLENEIAIPVLVLSWVGGYAVCAKMVGNLRKNRLLNARDAALVVLLGCCSSPGFVIGCVGGLLMGNVRLGILFFWLQLAANLAAAALCIGLLPRKTAQSVSPKATVPESVSFSNAIGNAVGSCLQVCGCVLFFPHDRSRTGTVSSSNGTYHTRDECFFGDQRRLFGFCRAGRALCAVWMLCLPECAGAFGVGADLLAASGSGAAAFAACASDGSSVCIFGDGWTFGAFSPRNGGGIPQHGGTRCHHTAVAMGRCSSRLCIPVRFPLQGQAKLL